MAGSVQRTVSTSATLLDVDATAGTARSVLIRNRGSVAVFIGGPDVTTNNGYQIDPGESIGIDTAGGTWTTAATYAVVASGPAPVHVMQI